MGLDHHGEIDVAAALRLAGDADALAVPDPGRHLDLEALATDLEHALRAGHDLLEGDAGLRRRIGARLAPVDAPAPRAGGAEARRRVAGPEVASDPTEQRIEAGVDRGRASVPAGRRRGGRTAHRPA